MSATQVQPTAAAFREQLISEGFCVFPQVLSDDLLARLRSVTNRLMDAIDAERRKAMGNQGTIVTMAYQDPAFQDLIGWPGSLEALRALGFHRPKYWSGYPIAKEPHSPPLYWHQDWPFWDEPESADPVPHQLFLMYYLTDTRPENGCLRVIPRSHRVRHSLHDLIGKGHEGEIRHLGDYSHPAYANDPAQVDIAVRAGDLVIGDARLLHAAHANQTDQRRTVITLWYFPRHDEASERLRWWRRRLFVDVPPGADAATLAEVERVRWLFPDYAGNAEPAEWNRVPGGHLRADDSGGRSV